MKHLKRTAWSLALAAVLVSAAWAQKHPSELKFPGQEFSPRRAEKAVLSNGIRVFLMPDHEIPVVRLSLYFPGGSHYDPAGKEGLAELTAAVMQNGGTASLPMESFYEEKEHRAVDIAVGNGKDVLTAWAQCLKQHEDWTLETLSELLRSPLLPEKTLTVERAKLLEGVVRRWDNPGMLTGETFRRMLYGAGDPRGRQPSQTSAQALGLEDLRAFHAAYFVPDHAILGVRGDFDGKAMLAKLEKLFGAWPRKATPKPELPPLTQTPQRKIYYVHRPGLRQTNIAMGHFGVNLLDPDMQKIEVFNLIFGSGSMSNRLFRSVRSEKGFAYSVSGRVRGNIDRGLFLILCQTKPDSTVDAIETVFGEIEKIRSAPPSPDEMRGAADATINSFVFEFEDAGDVLHKSMDIAFYGYPEDYWDGYLKRIRAVTAADVTAMAVKHVRPEEILTVVVGDEALFGRPLSDLGEVVRVTPDWK